MQLNMEFVSHTSNSLYFILQVFPLRFLFLKRLATPQVTLYTPEGGPITGGTLVTIFGSNLQEDIQYQCLFGNQAVNATRNFYSMKKNLHIEKLHLDIL